MAEKELLQLCGSVEEVIYRNDSNGYTVLTIMNNGLTATAVGMMSSVNIGDNLKLIGNWKNHSSYGQQFAFDFYEQSVPEGKENILKYLSSGAIKGIGKATAKRLVDEFGEDTLEIIRNEPDRLEKVKGISHEKAQILSSEIKKIFGMREIMLELEGYQISAQEALKIWKCFGAKAAEIIKDNPYVLCDEKIGIEFKRADNIAAKLQKSADDECRVRAGIIYVLAKNIRNGHTCLPKEIVIDITAQFLILERELVCNTVSMMTDDGTLVCDTVDEREFLFLPFLHKSERYISDSFKLMLKYPPERITGAEKALERFEKSRNIRYAELQRQAIEEALSGGLLILTGGPGTGKTTTLKAIIELYKQNGLEVSLAAPTGRAAQRMSELTGCSAKTIHRLLGVEWDKDGNPVFRKNERNRLECDALIIDELSMVDVLLFEGVMKALPIGCRLIMVGDSDQLPSVSAGNVLGDLISSGKIPVIQLTEIFRQSMQSLIVTNAHKIVKGNMPEITRTDSDFFFMACHDKETVSSKIVDLCSTRLPNTYHYSSFDDIQVLCAGRKGELGVASLNKKLQEVLNPEKEGSAEVKTPDYTFRTGDKVMQTKNNYDLLWTKTDGTEGAGVFNGDIGRIVSINKRDKTVYVRFDDRTAVYDSESLLNLELAYATTVHKSQGNEFNAVIIPMSGVPKLLCYRNLLYTAVTRAKKTLILIGNVDTLKSMVANNKKTLRYSGLKSFLQQELT